MRNASWHLLIFMSYALSYVKQSVNDEYIEYILERIDDAVKHSLQLGNPLDSLQRPQDSKNPQRLNGA